jgi:multidrug transporter EmrE-like cation transporter
VVAVCSATLYDIGYVLEKQALSGLPPVSARLTSVLRLLRSSRRWLFGFVAMVAALGLQVLALTMAPVSVVQPVLMAGLVALVVLGGRVLGERLGWRQRAALILILAAVAAIAVSAGAGGRVAPWVFLVATVVGLTVFQVGLQRHPASLMASVSNSASGLCALLGASVVSGELLLPPGWWSLARVAGFVAVVASAAVLVTGRRASSEAAVT